VKLAYLSVLLLLACSTAEPSPPDPMRTLDEIDLETWRKVCDAALVRSEGRTNPPRAIDVIRWTCTTKDGIDAELQIRASNNRVEAVFVKGGLGVPDHRFEDVAYHLFLPVLRPKYAYLADLAARSTAKPAIEPIEKVMFEHYKGSPLGSLMMAFRSP
jgi:hypothetical protein